MRSFILAFGLIFVTFSAQGRTAVDIAFDKLAANGFSPTEAIVGKLTRKQTQSLIEKVLAGDYLAKEEAISFQARMQIARRAFRTSRDAGDYARQFGPFIGLDFLMTLTSLKNSQKWLDGGSGQGVAIRRYLRGDTVVNQLHYHFIHRANAIPLKDRAQVLGITFSSKPSTLRNSRSLSTSVTLSEEQQTKFQEIKDRRFDQISDEEIGKVDLITDFYGIFSYDDDPMGVINRYLERLNRGGKIFMYSDSVFVGKKWSSAVQFGQWLNAQNVWGLDIYFDGHAFSITKVEEGVQLPASPVLAIKEDKVPINKLIQPCESLVTAAL